MIHAKNHAKKCVRTLLEAFLETRRIEVSSNALRLWVDAMSDLTYEEIALAILRFNREAQGAFPTPDRLRMFAPIPGLMSNEDRAKLAWASVKKAMATKGSYQSIDFSDRLINAAIRALGGWPQLCGTDTDQLCWKEKEFIRHYCIAAQTGIGDGAPLLGLAARENLSNGLPAPKVQRIQCDWPDHPVQSRLTRATSDHPAPGLPTSVQKHLEHFASMEG